MEQARADYAAVANAVAAFEPVTMIANPGDDAALAGRRARRGRDRRAPARRLVAARLRPDLRLRRRRRRGWPCTSASTPGARSSRRGTAMRPSAALIAEQLGDRVVDGGMVLEGGSILTDGAGTLLTTEQCLLQPEPQPVAVARGDRGRRCASRLGVERIVWLGHGAARGPRHRRPRRPDRRVHRPRAGAAADRRARTTPTTTTAPRTARRLRRGRGGGRPRCRSCRTPRWPARASPPAT